MISLHIGTSLFLNSVRVSIDSYARSNTAGVTAPLSNDESQFLNTDFRQTNDSRSTFLQHFPTMTKMIQAYRCYFLSAQSMISYSSFPRGDTPWGHTGSACPVRMPCSLKNRSQRVNDQ